MKLPSTIEHKGIRVLTTKQLAEAYETDEKKIQYNFRYNKNKYEEGKHYIEVTGEELRVLKSRNEFQSSLKQVKHIYLWTEKGALLHAKSLNTDKAWEVYDYLVDFYFRQQDVKKIEEKTGAKEIVPVNQSTRKIPDAIEKKEETPANNMFRGLRAAKGMVVDIPDNREARKLIEEMRKYITGMDAILDLYSMYLDEEKFKCVASTLYEMCGKISRTGLFMYTFKPKIVERYL